MILSINNLLNNSIHAKNISLNSFMQKGNILGVALLVLAGLGACFYYLFLSHRTSKENKKFSQNPLDVQIPFSLAPLQKQMPHTPTNSDKHENSASPLVVIQKNELQHPISQTPIDQKTNTLQTKPHQTLPKSLEVPKDNYIAPKNLFLSDFSMDPPFLENKQNTHSISDPLPSEDDKDLETALITSQFDTINTQDLDTEDLELQEAILLSQMDQKGSPPLPLPQLLPKPSSKNFVSSQLSPHPTLKPLQQKNNPIEEDDLVKTTNANSDKCEEALRLAVESAKEKKALRISNYTIERNSVGNAYLKLHFANKVHRNLCLAELKQQYGFFPNKKLPILIGEKILRLTVEETIEFQMKF